MSAGEALIHARGLTKQFGDLTAVDGIDFDVQRGEAFGFLGPNGAGKSSTMRMIGCVSPADRRHAARARPRPGARRPGDPRSPRRRAAARHARQRAHRAREPPHLRPLLRPLAQGVAHARRRAARVRPALRARDGHGRAALRRHEAPPDDRALARQRSRAAAARRADDRPRPAGAARRLGQALPPQAAGRDARADDALHGRGGAALRPARDHGPRQDRRGGLAARADPAALDARGRRAALSPAIRRTSRPSVFDGQVARIEVLPDRAASLHRRRRRARPASRTSGCSRRACSSAARRSRTSSSASPAARSSTDGRTRFARTSTGCVFVSARRGAAASSRASSTRCCT